MRLLFVHICIEYIFARNKRVAEECELKISRRGLLHFQECPSFMIIIFIYLHYKTTGTIYSKRDNSSNSKIEIHFYEYYSTMTIFLSRLLQANLREESGIVLSRMRQWQSESQTMLSFVQGPWNSFSLPDGHRNRRSGLAGLGEATDKETRAAERGETFFTCKSIRSERNNAWHSCISEIAIYTAHMRFYSDLRYFFL